MHVPIFVPRIRGMAEPRSNNPLPAIITIIPVVTELDCTTAVAIAPISIPKSGFELNAEKKFCIAGPFPNVFAAPPMILSPRNNIPKPRIASPICRVCFFFPKMYIKLPTATIGSA